MNLFKFMKEWKDRKENSDLKKVRITPTGAFYIRSEDLFNDKRETLALLQKLNNSVKNHNTGE